MGRPKKITPTIEKAPARLPGTHDVLPDQHLGFDFFLGKFMDLAHTFGYSRIETPMIEDARLFKQWEQLGNGELVRINDDKGNARMALKPNALFGIVRAYLEYQFPEKEKVSKWFFVSPYNYAQAGQIKHGHEYGLHIFGETAPIADAQVINLLYKLFGDLGITDLSLEINNIGCLECLPGYQEVLRNYFKDKKYDLCENCVELIDTYPVKILACNNIGCSTVAAEAPMLVDYLDENCRRHFIGVLEGLDELGLMYNLNPKIIGSPWSRKTVFEIRCRVNDQEYILGCGGHADDLIQSFGGLPASSLGFTGRVEDLLGLFNAANIKFAASSNKVDVYLVPLGDLAAKKTLKLFSELWGHNIAASEFIGPGSIKTQLKLAESNKVSIALIIGQKEAREGTVILRDVRSGMQELFTAERIIEEVKKRLGR
jgi:histidyl-tRNA synthetase